MGFCIFNFAVIAARYALDVLGLQRVAILGRYPFLNQHELFK
jgi:acetoin utilization deacetylase AcuC-like enzyme